MCRTSEARKACIWSVTFSLVSAAACGISSGCQKTIIDRWERTEGTPLGTGGVPVMETGEIWRSQALWHTTHMSVQLQENGRRVWADAEVAACERLIVQTLGRSQPWQSGVALDSFERSEFPVTAYLVSTGPAIVVVVPRACIPRVLFGRSLEEASLGPQSLRGRIGEFTQAASRVPAADFAAVYLPDAGIGPMPLARGESLQFATQGGGVRLQSQPDGWVAQWIQAEPLTATWERWLRVFDGWAKLDH